MKKVLSVFTMLLFCGAVVAQSTFVMKDYNDNVITNDQQIDVWADASIIEMDYGLHTENTGSSSVILGCKRYEVNVVSGSQNYFCWNVCYSPTDAGAQPYWVAQDPLTVETDSVYSNFHAYHRPTGTTGISTYRYVFYNQANPNDSISVTFTFNASPTSVEDLMATEKLAIYPNPAVDVAHVNYNLSGGKDAELVLHNMLGSKVKEIKLNPDQNKLDLSVRDLNPGVYFYTLVEGGNTIATKRLVVSGK